MAHTLRYLIASLVISVVDLPAAQPSPPEQRVRFTVVCARPSAGLAYTPRPGLPPVSLVLYPTARSPSYDYHGAMPLRLTDLKTQTIVAEAVVPSQFTDALLLLVPIEPAPAAGLRYQVYVLDDTTVRQAPGTLAIINLTGLALSGTLDGKVVTPQTGLNPAQPVGRSASLMLRTTHKTRSYQAYAGVIELGRNERALLVLLPPFYKGSLEVQSRLLIDAPPGSPAASPRR